MGRKSETKGECGPTAQRDRGPVLRTRNPSGIELNPSQSPVGDFVYGGRDLGPGAVPYALAAITVERRTSPPEARSLAPLWD
jgi:hypothetical protein